MEAAQTVGARLEGEVKRVTGQALIEQYIVLSWGFSEEERKGQGQEDSHWHMICPKAPWIQSRILSTLICPHRLDADL